MAGWIWLGAKRCLAIGKQLRMACCTLLGAQMWLVTIQNGSMFSMGVERALSSHIELITMSIQPFWLVTRGQIQSHWLGEKSTWHRVSHGKCVRVDSRVDKRRGYSQLRHRVPYTEVFFGFSLGHIWEPYNVQRPNPKKNTVYGTLCRSWLQPHFMFTPEVDSNTLAMGIGQPYAESTLTLCQSRLYPLVKDFGFGLSKPFSTRVHICRSAGQRSTC
jgi:hypothetical protein